MSGYSLVIDISSDEENQRHSTPIKTLALNMIGTLNISDSSIEVYRGSEAELNSTYESECSPKRVRLTPPEKTSRRVIFKLPLTNKSQRANPDSDSDEYYEEPDSPRKVSPHKPSREANVPPAEPERKDSSNNLNDLNELPTRLETAEHCRKAWHTPEAENYFKKLTLELEREEKEV